MQPQHGKLCKFYREQRQKDMELGAWFVCHKVGCRPYKCYPRTNIVRIEKDAASADALFNSGESGEEWAQ